MVTDRPDFTESIETVPAGHVQSEGGYTFARNKSDDEHSIGEVLVRVGMAPWTELRLGANSYAVNGPKGNRTTGLEDANVGVKVRLLDGAKSPSLMPALSLIAATTVPTGARVLNDRAMRPEAKLAAAWELGDRFGLSGNANYSYESDAGTRFSQWAGSLSLGADVSETLGTYLEYYGFYGPSFAAEHYVNAGVTRPFGNNFQLDLRAGVRTNAPSRGYFFGAGFARRW